uniref:Uncharacterized protein n=1 Tax=Erpetoichthys calabaricus TaxID=27687 RepID=A0A8C4SY96_ERPCA
MITLEEKRRAIEAQKKRIEAIFAKHRQRLGKSAFLQLKKREEGNQPEGEDLCRYSEGCRFESPSLPKEILLCWALNL